jgi:hypothetical protein
MAVAVNACGRMPAWPFESGGTMRDQPDLVGLLYRADWTRLSLGAEVSVTLDRDLRRSRFDDEPPARARSVGLSGPWSAPWFAPWFGPPRVPEDEDLDESGEPDQPWEAPESGRRSGEPRGAGREWEMATEVLGTESRRFTLLIAPGKRYREQGEGCLSGCDGERSWHAVEEDGGWSVEAAGGPAPPTARLFQPSWLLRGFSLEPGGSVTVSGREAWRVVATPRPGIGIQRVVTRRPLDRIELAVDAELGILLRCEEVLDGRPLRVTELADVRVDIAPAGNDAPFQPPGGWDSVDDTEPPIIPNGPTPNGSGWEVAKLAAGLAAGGLGAWIKHSPFRPFEKATQEEAEAEMPSSDEPLPGEGAPASDEVLRLLHTSQDRWSPGIKATLHQWHDIAGMLAQIPDGARRAGFGGLGVLIDAAGDRIATAHTVFELHLGGSGQYRIEPLVYPRRPGGYSPGSVTCDGERLWRFGEDEVTTRPAVPLPREIAALFDASWLLDYPLTGGAEIVADGRSGYRLRAAFGGPWGSMFGPWGGMFFPGDVVVDAELGILLRCLSWAGTRPLTRYELRDITIAPAEPGDFQADIPADMPVVEESDDPPGPVNPVSVVALQAANQARSAVKTFLDGIRGENVR